MVIALAALLPALAGAAHAAEKGAVLIMDANSGRILYQRAADERRYPASLTKLMTLYIVFEQMAQGRLKANTPIEMTPAAAAVAPSKLGLEPGEKIPLIDAIKVLITKSANDVAVAIADHIAGSEIKFAQLMNAKARQLGMTHTVFQNASGLPDEDQVTTARDILTLALHLQDDFPEQYGLFSTRTFSYAGETFRNHNKLLFNYAGTDGLKTGYTRASGFNLVASVRRGRKHVIGVVFGGATASSRDHAMRTYLNMGLVKASSVVTRKPATPPLVAARRSPAPRPVATAAPAPRRVQRPATAAPPPAPAIVAQAPRTETAPEPPQQVRVRAVSLLRIQPGTPDPAAADASEPAAEGPDSIEAILASNPASPEPARPMRKWVSASADLPWRLSGPTKARDVPAAAPDPAVIALPPRAGDPPNLDSAPIIPPRPVPVAHRIAAPQPSPPATIAGGYVIQIGAFQSAAEAEQRLAAVRGHAGTLLARKSPVTQQVTLGGKVLYRARYTGFAAQADAAAACAQLKRRHVDCLPMKAD
ncbi:MAG TPA: SPOR domain-containing protein [Hyphomicrobiaceae bacterium]|nr:SPOR domain-containing protein [Hyphomicrobiaceae bacterium]